MSGMKVASATVSFPAHLVKSVYSGKHGCACGCRGNHSTRPNTIKLILAKIRAAAAEGAEVDINLNSFASYVAVETQTRQYIAYLNLDVAGREN